MRAKNFDEEVKTGPNEKGQSHGVRGMAEADPGLSNRRQITTD
jgi:hypothetical protein